MDNWRRVNRKIRKLNHELAELREKRERIKNCIIKHGLEDDRYEVVTKYTRYVPLTFKYLRECLADFNGTRMIDVILHIQAYRLKHLVSYQTIVRKK